MTILTKEQILNSVDLNRELIEVPEWGGSIYITEMTGKQRIEFGKKAQILQGKDAEKNVEKHLDLIVDFLSMVITDEAGNRLFTTQEDLESLSNKSLEVLSRLLETGLNLSGVSNKAVDEAREDLKNSQSGNSSTD